jgi:signal transduction histidine kinase/CheY-like chemotaxis protein/ligand-binding sensor domain-containing protein
MQRQGRIQYFFEFLAIRNICITLFCLLFCSCIWAQVIEPPHFDALTHYSTENGLASNRTNDIIEDRHGYLWIATENGVARFDGNHFTNYENYNLKEGINAIGFVNKLSMNSSKDSLWIAGAKGLFYTSIEKLDIKKITIPQITKELSIERVDDFLIDKKQLLWATTFGNGLLKIDIKHKISNTYTFINKNQKDNSKLNYLRTIVKDPIDGNVLWLGTGAGLIRFNTITYAYKVYVFGNDTQKYENHIRNIHVTDTDVFWGTWNAAVIRLDKKTEKFYQPVKDKYPNKHELILSLYEDSKQLLWISTNDGLIAYDTRLNSIQKEIPHNLAKGIMRGVSFVDSRGIIWFCDGKGLFKYDPLQSLDTFIALEERSNLENPMLVREILSVNDYFYVLGQYSSGLYKISLKDYSLEIIKLPLLEYSDEIGYNLKDMVLMDDGNFLIIAEKIIIYNPTTQKGTLSPLQINHPNPSIQAVVKDKNNNYWVGTRNAGLFRLNFKENSILNYKEEFDVFKKGNHAWINKLYLDKLDKLWIAKGSTTVMDVSNSTFQILNPSDSVLWYQDVGGFYEDKKGRVWVAGYDRGMGFTNYEEFNKGISHQIEGYFSGVYAYNDSLLWTTGKGQLGAIDMQNASHSTVQLNSSNNNLYVSGPIVSFKKEQFIIGCDNGVVIHDSAENDVHNEVPIPYIRKIMANGKPIYEGNNLDENKFFFKSNTKNITANISSLGFHQSDKITFQYSIQNEWIKLGSSQEISFTNLSHGDYNLKIKACNYLGKCNAAAVNYKIIIRTPWVASWWAYTLYFVLIGGVLFWFYRFQISRKLVIAESQRLKEVNSLKNSLYTNITHEFRTPLTVILGMAASLKEAAEQKHFKEADGPLEMISRNGQNLLHLVNEMLDLSKLESGKMELHLIQTDIIPFIKYLCESFQPYAEDAKTPLTIYCEIDKLIMDFDTHKMQTIISNLVSNAIKFSPKGGKIIVHLNKIAKAKKHYFLLKVKDSGIGIPDDKLSDIFSRFYQVDNSTSRKGEGTGIGLAITKEFVNLLGGAVEVKSTLGKGSEFTITLPISNTALIEERIQHTFEDKFNFRKAPQVEITPQADLSFELPLVLLIEDNLDVSHYLKDCLQGHYEVIHAENGIIGLDLAFENIPDIIICDVMMPGKDGYEVCSDLKKDERTDHIPVIILTAKSTLQDRLTGLSCGADAYLTKPFNKVELFTRLDQLVAQRRKMMLKMQNHDLQQMLKKRFQDPELKFIQKIVKIVQGEIANPNFGSRHLARKLLLSESQVYRKLKAITGKSTALYIRSVRLSKAKELLQTTDKSISEIGYETGFNDPSWFSRAFKEEFGYPPIDVRN